MWVYFLTSSIKDFIVYNVNSIFLITSPTLPRVHINKKSFINRKNNKAVFKKKNLTQLK